MRLLPRPLAPGRRALGARLIANGLGQAAAGALTALVVQRAFDDLIAEDGATTPMRLAAVGLVLAAAASAAGGLRVLERIDAERLGQRYVHDVRMVLFDHLGRVDQRVLERRRHGAVALRFTGDLTSLRQWVSLGLARLGVSAVMAAGTVGALAIIAPLTAIAVVLVVAIAASVALARGPALRTASAEARRKRARLAGNVTEQVARQGVVRMFGQAQREARRVARQSRDLADAMCRRARRAGEIQGLAEATVTLAAAAVLIVGAAEVNAGRGTPGAVVASLMVVGLLAAPLRDLGRVSEYWHASRVALENLETFLALPARGASENAPDLAPAGAALVIRDLTVTGSLDGVTASAPSGAIVALVGPSGSGKSTLLAVLAGLVPPDRGSVLLGGQDIHGARPASLPRHIALVSPDLPLLRGSIDRNLRYGQPDTDESDLRRAVERTGASALIDRLPDGIGTRVSELGLGLSAGERQRLTLARALVSRPLLLLLDEADAHLGEGDRDLITRIAADHEGTVVIATHRDEVCGLADVIWRMEAGRLLETPTRVPAGA